MIKFPYHYPNKPKYILHKIWAWVNVRIPRRYWAVHWAGYGTLCGLGEAEAHTEKLDIMHDYTVYANDVKVYSYWSTPIKQDDMPEFGGW